jgi:hypothetical protein
LARAAGITFSSEQFFKGVILLDMGKLECTNVARLAVRSLADLLAGSRTNACIGR